MRGLRMTIPHHMQGARLDVAIATLAPEISRRAARRMIEDGAVLVDGQRIRVQSRVLRAGTIIEVHVAAPHAAPAHAVEILALKEGIVVANKPAGMPTEPTRQGAGGTLLVELTDQLKKRGASVDFLAAVHRLDTHTSGVVVFARTREAASNLGAQLQAGTVKRRYLALVQGLPPFTRKRFDAALAKKPDADGRIYATPEERGGVSALTFAVVLARGDDAALLWCAPRTGRMHQIRVHLADAGHPLVDDKRYARPDKPSPHPGLHALSIGFHNARGEISTYAAAPPAAFVAACVARGISEAALAAVTASMALQP